MTAPVTIKLVAGMAMTFTILVAAPAWAQHERTYIAAVRAYRAEQWEQATALFQRARELNSNETGRVQISGNDVEAYTPSYFLAHAYARLRNCNGAHAAFDDAERIASARRDRGMLQRIATGRSKCPMTANAGNNPAVLAPPVATPQVLAQQAGANPSGPPPPSAEALRFEAVRASAQTALQEATDAERAAVAAGSPQANASAQLVSARSLFNDAASTRNASRMETAARLASASRDMFKGAVSNQGLRLPAALADAQSKLSAAQAKAKRVATLLGGQPSTTFANATALLNRASSRLATTPLTLDEVAASTADTRSADRTLDLVADEIGKSVAATTSVRLEALGQNLSRLERSLGGREAAATAADRKTVSELHELLALTTKHADAAATDPDAMQAFNTRADDLESRIGGMTRAIESRIASASGIPVTLLQAAREYFAGRYEGARTALEQIGTPDPRPGVRLQTALFRAAATYALYVVGGERDPSLRHAAGEAVAECRRLAPTYTPDAVAFSPRFLAFYASVPGR